MVERYKNPPIPMGYRHVEGTTWENGFTIERIFDGSRLTWIPVGALTANGTQNGTDFNQKFGRRFFGDTSYPNSDYHEIYDKYYMRMVESVEYYGGFYVSSYNISRCKTGRPQSKADKYPWTNLTFEEAKKIAKRFEMDIFVSSHLLYASEFDTMHQWFLESGARTYEELAIDSSKIGNYHDSLKGSIRILKTASKEEWSTNGVYDHAGNCQEWTQEYNKFMNVVVRGGNCISYGNLNPSVSRNPGYAFKTSLYIGFRIALCISPNAYCTYLE